MGKLFLSILVFTGIVINRIESKRSRKSKSACVNPNNSLLYGWICSGKGDCHKTRRGPDWCECYPVNQNGISTQWGKRLFGKWCQCNPWNCLNYQLSRDSKVASNYLIINRE